MARNVESGKGCGVTSRVRRRGSDRGAALRWVALVVVLFLLGGAAAAYRLDLVDRWFAGDPPDPISEPAAVLPPESVDVAALPSPAAVAQPADPSRPAPGQVRRALTSGLADRDLGRSVHAMVAGLTGPVWSTGDDPFVPASTLKLLTATAALATLGPDHRFDTTVVARGRDVTLVGGGDPLLASRPATTDGWPPRADITTLARRTARALRDRGVRRPVRLAYDDSLFTGPVENPYWRADYVPDGIVSPITALWVDEGRSPSGFGRVADPSAAAAEVFRAALVDQGVEVKGSTVAEPAPPGAKQVASVESPPLAQIVEWVLEVSDNEGAEVLARHVGLAVLDDGSFAGGARAVRRTLTDLGVPLNGAVIHDGSGLSRRNRLRARTLVEVLRVAAQDDRPELRSVVTGLPVGAFTGSLAYRLDDAPDAGIGRVRAKTGTLTGVHSLAGIVTDQNGAPLVFVLAADRVRLRNNLDARQALDNLAGALGACACSR